MKFILGKDRNQISFFCLEEQIDQNNEIRLIELFVNSINLADAGFKMDFIENGRPAYHPADLLKLFFVLVTELSSVHKTLRKITLTNCHECTNKKHYCVQEKN